MDKLSIFGNKNYPKIYLKLHIFLRAVFAKLSDHLTCLVKNSLINMNQNFYQVFQQKILVFKMMNVSGPSVSQAYIFCFQSITRQPLEIF